MLFAALSSSWARRVSNPRPLACEAQTRGDNSGLFAGRKQNLDDRDLRDLTGGLRDLPGFRPSDGLLEEHGAAVQAGSWRKPELPACGDEGDPTFRAYASSWLEDNLLEWRASMTKDVK
jgi:hypothetical protein